MDSPEEFPTAEVSDHDPSLPRAVTRRAAWRAWTEPHVRLWWMTAAVIFAAGAYVAVRQLSDWYTETRLIDRGTPVTAYVEKVNDKDREGNGQPGDSPVILRFDWRGQPRKAAGYLAGRPPAQFIAVDEPIQIRVDPKAADASANVSLDPAGWTSREQPATVSSKLGIPLAVVSIALLVGAASWMLRRRVLRTYQAGDLVHAQVISRSRSALAPRVWTVRCALVDGEDKRVFTAYVPHRFVSDPGEIVEVIVPHKGGRVLAAGWFE